MQGVTRLHGIKLIADLEHVTIAKGAHPVAVFTMKMSDRDELEKRWRIPENRGRSEKCNY